MFDRKPHDGPDGGAGPQLLEDVEAALAAFKGSALSDRDTQTVELMELMMAVTNANKAEVRTELDDWAGDCLSVSLSLRLCPFCFTLVRARVVV